MLTRVAILALWLPFAQPLACGEEEAEEPSDFRVAARPEKKAAREHSTEQLQAAAKKVMALPSISGPAEKNEQVLAAAAEFRNDPELYARLLIPPGSARSVSFASKDLRTRVAALLGLSRDRRALQPLVNSAVYDPEEAVRVAAADALPLLEEPIALRKLIDLAIAGDYARYPWSVRKCACQAIRRYGEKEAVEKLLRELAYELAGGNPADPHNRPRGVTHGLATENPLMLPDGPPDLRLSQEDMYPVLSALKEVTGKSFDSGEKDVKTWTGWWRKEGDAFTFKKQ